MPVTSRMEEVRAEVSELAAATSTAQDLMDKMVNLLHHRMLKYNWVGFYLLEPGAEPPMLVLGAFEGAMTPHTRIPLNQGICGAAASSGHTVVVDDVSKDPAIWRVRLKPSRRSSCPCLCMARWLANWILTATFRRRSLANIRNWCRTAPCSWGRSWKPPVSKSPRMKVNP